MIETQNTKPGSVATQPGLRFERHIKFDRINSNFAGDEKQAKPCKIIEFPLSRVGLFAAHDGYSTASFVDGALALDATPLVMFDWPSYLPANDDCAVVPMPARTWRELVEIYPTCDEGEVVTGPSASSETEAAITASEAGDVTIELTKFVKDQGILSKEISLGADGKPVSDGSGCRMTHGRSYRVRVTGFAGLAAFLDAMQPNEALATGTMPKEFGDVKDIRSQKEIDRVNFANAVSRTLGNYIYVEGAPCAFLMDHDTKGMPDHVRARLSELAETLPREERARLGDMAGFVAALALLIRDFDGVGYVVRGSTSGGLYNTETGEEFPGSGGLHCYLIIADGSDSPRAIRALQDRAWLNGLGWHMIGKGGQLLKRAIVDISVPSPERLNFEGRAVITLPLAQHPRKCIVREGRLLDTRVCVPDLTTAERAAVAKLEEESARSLGKELKSARKRVEDERVAKRVAMGEDEATARKSIERTFDGDQITLFPQIPLCFDNRELGEVTVGDVLEKTAKYDGATLADPIEPCGEGDYVLRNKAIMFVGQDGDPLVYSCIHGGMLFRLRWDFASMNARIAAADRKSVSEKAAVVPTLVKMLLVGGADSPVTESEEAILIDEAAKKSGAGKRSIQSELKDARARRTPDRVADVPDDLDSSDPSEWPVDRAGWPDVNKAFEPTPTLENTKLAIRRMGITVARDEFRGADLFSGELNGNHFCEEEVNDRIIRLVRERIRILYDFDAGKENVDEALLTLADHRQYHPIRDWLGTPVWDGVPRLDRLFVDYFGAEDTELHHMFARKSMIAAVRRVRRPGVKHDCMVIFEGGQGSGKTTALRILAGEDFHRSGNALSLEDTAKFVEQTRGAWFYESGELISFKRAEVEHLKEVMSRTTDRCRPAYARRVIDVARQAVFWGSTNTSDYLRDATGNRRFWPVKTGEIDLEGLRRDRDMIWAEAAYYESQGEPLELPEELWGVAAVAQASRMEADPWEDTLRGIEHDQYAAHLVDPFYRVSAPKIRDEKLGLKNPTRADNRRLADVMRGLGWVGPAPMSLGDGNGGVRAYEKAVALVRAKELETLLDELASHMSDVPQEWNAVAASARKVGVALGEASDAYRRAVETRRGLGDKATQKAMKAADAHCARAKSDLAVLTTAAQRAVEAVEAVEAIIEAAKEVAKHAKNGQDSGATASETTRKSADAELYSDAPF